MTSAGLVAEPRSHMVERFPASVVMGGSYGDVDAVMVAEEIFVGGVRVSDGYRLRRLIASYSGRAVAALKRSRTAFPFRPYYVVA